MRDASQPTTVGPLPETGRTTPRTPLVLTRLVWLLWAGSLGAVAARPLVGGPWAVGGLVVVDGLTRLLWTVVTFFAGIVHSYARRYLAGERGVARFFRRVFGFTLAVLVLVAADHVVLFALAWLSMGLAMAALIGHVRDWPQARVAARLARRYFLASTAALALALGTLWWATGDPSIAGLATAGDAVSPPVLWIAVGGLLLAATIQSALVPFHTWLLASMTAPTPASALMHAGFVNAGGILLVRFAPLVSLDPSVMLLVVVVGTVSALSGKLLKSVQPDNKRQLGCSTVGQMGFMLLQAGLGFFGAAITHLVLHGFYKAYQFLSVGEAIERTSPTAEGTAPRGPGVTGAVATVATGLAGGALFARLTGKGLAVDGGLVLTLLVVVLCLHATRELVRRRSLPATVRYAAVPLVGLPAIAVYAAVYAAVTTLLADLPVVTAPVEPTPVHAAVAVAFVAAYVAVETGIHRRSRRLYVALVTAGRPPAGALLSVRDPRAQAQAQAEGEGEGRDGR